MNRRCLAVMMGVACLVASGCGGASQAPAPVAPSPTVAQPAPATPPATGNDTASGVDAAVPSDATRVQGVIRGIRGTCPDLALRVNTQIVRTARRTTFEGKTCGQLTVNTPALIVGRLQPDGVMLAAVVRTRK